MEEKELFWSIIFSKNEMHYLVPLSTLLVSTQHYVSIHHCITLHHETVFVNHVILSLLKRLENEGEHSHTVWLQVTVTV